MKGNNGARAMLAAGVAMAVGLAGCFPPRESIYADLHASRSRAYTRWLECIGQEEDLPCLDGDLSTRDAVRVALAYNKELRGVVQEREKAHGRVLEAYGEALPTVSLNAGYTRLDQITTVDLGFDSFQVGAKNNWSYDLSVTQPLYRGGAIPAAMRGAQLYRCMSDEGVRQAVQDVVLAVVGAYYDVLLAQRLFEVQENALEFAEANLKDVIARQEQGLAIRYDRLRAELEVSNVKADLIRQRNELSRARAALFRAMGVSQKSQVALANSLTYAPLTPTYEEAVEEAFKQRPELYQAELDVRLQQEALRSFYADYWPNVEGWGWYQWAKPDPHESTNISWGRQWQAGLRLDWTLFDGLRREGQIIQQKALLRQSAIHLTDTEQSVLQEVRNALLDLGDADELVESQWLNLERANEALRLVTIGAREGVNTALEVLDGRSALTHAQGLYYQALHAHSMARLAYQRAIGLLGPGPGVGEVPSEAPAAVPDAQEGAEAPPAE